MSFENFPYSNFHDMNLDWVINKMNSLINEWAQMQSDFSDLNKSFNDLKNYVSSYFENLNIQDEVNKKLDEMYNEGLLAVLVSNKAFTPMFVGDSYNSPGINPITWGVYAAQCMGLSSGHYLTYGYSSRGFVGYGDGDYITELKKDVPNIPEATRNSVTHVVFCGGANDSNANVTEEKLTKAMKNTFEYIRSMFPNAMIMNGFISRSVSGKSNYQMCRMRSLYMDITPTLNATYLNGVENIFAKYTLWKNDALHPTQDGAYVLGKYIAQAVKNGSVTIYDNLKPCTLTELNTTNFEFNDTDNLICEEYKNGKVTINIMEKNINISSDTTSQAIKLCSISSNYIRINEFVENGTLGYKAVPVHLQPFSSSACRSTTGYLFFIGNGVQLQIPDKKTGEAFSGKIVQSSFEADLQ